MNNFQNSCARGPRSGSVRPSFGDVLEQIKGRVEYDGIQRNSALVLELCKIIAEAMLLNPEREMQIGRDMIPVSLVQEIFCTLERDHLELVIDNFRAQSEPIRNKKAYLRAALYNSAFEIEAHYANAVSCDR